MTFVAIHAEKWLYGSTRQELEPDESYAWTVMLARAAITGADPPGLIYFTSENHLAQQLQLPIDLVQRTFEKCKKFKKIKINFSKRQEIYVLSISNWNKYQHIYMSQKAYRQRQKALKAKQKASMEGGTKKDNRDITGYPRDIDGEEDRRGEERIGEEKRIDDTRGEDNGKPSASYIKKFVSLIRELSKSTSYPFNEELEASLLIQASRICPNVDFMQEAEKKFQWWEEHPEALSRTHDPRRDLLKFFALEEKYQANG